MNRLIPAAIICLSLIAAPAFSQQKQHDITELPKDLLVQGLQASAVCMEIEGYGIRKLMALYEENKDELTGANSEAAKSAAAATMLYEEFLIERTLAGGIVMAFKDKYKMSDKQIGDLIRDEVEATKQSMTDKYDSLDTYDDFTKSYEVSLNSCSDVLKAFTEKVKSILENLDKPAVKP